MTRTGKELQKGNNIALLVSLAIILALLILYLYL